MSQDIQPSVSNSLGKEESTPSSSTDVPKGQASSTSPRKKNYPFDRENLKYFHLLKTY